MRSRWLAPLLVCSVLGACTSDSVADGAGIEGAGIEGAVVDAGQAAILADGRIGFAEYEAALGAAISCARAKGVQIAGPNRGTDGVTFDYSIAEGDGTAAEEFDRCYDDLAMDVDLAFQSSPEVQAARDLYFSQVANCVFGEEAESWNAATREQFVRSEATAEPDFESCRAGTTDPRAVVATVQNE